MSEEIKETLTEKEAMEAIGAFANMCYDKGVRDTLIGVVVGAVVSTLFMAGVEAIDVWKDRKKTEKQIKEFNEFKSITGKTDYEERTSLSTDHKGR